MSDEEMRIAIAEHLGMNVVKVPFVPAKIKTDKNTVFTPEAAKVFYSCYGSAGSVRVVPNYPEDLNACHEMEKSLGDEQQKRLYVDHLAWLMRKGEFTVMAPARQRAEAFLRTVGKWKE